MENKPDNFEFSEDMLTLTINVGIGELSKFGKEVLGHYKSIKLQVWR